MMSQVFYHRATTTGKALHSFLAHLIVAELKGPSKLTKDKRTSLFCLVVSDEEKGLNLDTWLISNFGIRLDN